MIDYLSTENVKSNHIGLGRVALAWDLLAYGGKIWLGQELKIKSLVFRGSILDIELFPTVLSNKSFQPLK